MTKRIAKVLGVIGGAIVLCGALLTMLLLGVAQNEAQQVGQATTLQCAGGTTEDSCYPDYIGKGKWVLREGEQPLPKATIAGVCMTARVTPDMVADCNKLAHRPAEVTSSYSNPKGEVLVKECLDSYTDHDELKICLAP